MQLRKAPRKESDSGLEHGAPVSTQRDHPSSLVLGEARDRATQTALFSDFWPRLLVIVLEIQSQESDKMFFVSLLKMIDRVRVVFHKFFSPSCIFPSTFHIKDSL